MKRHSHKFKGVAKKHDAIVEFIDMMKRIHLHLYPEIAKDNPKVLLSSPKPTQEELQAFTAKINSILSQDRILPKY